MNYRNFYEFEEYYSMPYSEKKYDEVLNLLHHANELLPKHEYEIHLPKSYDSTKKHPLFFCLHGDGFDCNIKNTSWYWKADVLLEKGYIVIYAQSSQIYFHNSFGWLSDPALSRKELKNCYEQLLLDYSIDETCVLIGGFSGGATTSIDIASHNTIPIKGVIALCPGDYLDNIEIKDITKLAERKTKIDILEGDKNTDPVVQHLLKLFRECELDHEYYINKGIGHEYPKDLAEKTLKAVAFIVSN